MTDANEMSFASEQDTSIKELKLTKEFDVELSHIQEKMMNFQQELIKEINEKSEKMKLDIEQLLHSKTKRDVSGIEKAAALSKIKKDGSREKVFMHRESLLTELFRISHIRTLRHVFISILIIICFQIIVYDLTTFGKVNLDFDLFRWSFEGFVDTMLFTWLPMKLTALVLVYLVFFYWSTKRENLSSSFKRVFDFFFLTLYIAYLILFIFLPLISVKKISLACRIVILMEQVRLLMKSHAFVRSNIPKALKHHENQEKDKSTQLKPPGCPVFSKYLYFMFAPTLVYRDDYPRTSKIRWGVVIEHFIEIFGSIIYTYCLFDRYCVPVFRSLDVKNLDYKSYIQLISLCIMPGALMQMMVFFSFLHCWHNAWAEMLRFGDRQFYLDWWNSTSFNMYYRTWNTLVQDWLYTYIYRDLYKVFGKKYRSVFQFLVIFISSVFHEHILSFTFGFFYPIMFIMFAGFGFICLFIPRGNSAPWNIFIWISLFTGLGIQICMFSIEWYARDQCPRKIDSLIDYFLPRSIFCSK